MPVINIRIAKKVFVRNVLYLIGLMLIVIVAGCGSGNSNPATGNNGLFGSWNITLFPTGSSNPSYVFALAISQEGTNNYSGSSITYTGTIPVPTNQCINSSELRSTATVNGSNFTMTVTDSTTQTVITMSGSLGTINSTLSGTYTNPASPTCAASSGTFTMAPQ